MCEMNKNNPCGTDFDGKICACDEVKENSLSCFPLDRNGSAGVMRTFWSATSLGLLLLDWMYSPEGNSLGCSFVTFYSMLIF